MNDFKTSEIAFSIDEKPFKPRPLNRFFAIGAVLFLVPIMLGMICAGFAQKAFSSKEISPNSQESL